MAEFTSNYNLKKPSDDDFYNVADFNGNADAVDKELKNQDGRLTKLEAPSFTDVEELKNISAGEVLQTMLAKVKKAIASLITHLGAENPHSGSAAKNHAHTADEISETSEKKVLTAAERTKLAGIAAGATKNIVDTELDKNSTNAVCNKVVTETLGEQLTSILGMSLYASRLASHVSEQGAFGTDGDGSSGKMYLGELLLQWGFVKKANAQGDTVESVNVSFDKNYYYKNDNSFFAVAAPITSVPQKISVAVSGRTKSGFVINHFRTSTQETHIVWLTLGRGTKNATEAAIGSGE